MIDYGGQVIEYLRTRRQRTPSECAGPAGPDQVGDATQQHAGMQIAMAVAHHRNALEIGQAEVLGDGAKHPGLGLAAVATIVRAVGQCTIRSMRPPCPITSCCILKCMSPRVLRSNLPRATPDWLVATATVQPALHNRAIASSDPEWESTPPPT